MGLKSAKTERNDLCAPKLTPEATEFAILSLAGWGRQRAIIQNLREQFNISISPSAISQFQTRHREEIGELRMRRMEAMDIKNGSIPFVHKQERVIALSSLAMRAISRGDSREAREALRDIAEELEDITEKHDVTGGGERIDNLSTEELISELAEIFGPPSLSQS